jgi:hypothetical protein
MYRPFPVRPAMRTGAHVLVGDITADSKPPANRLSANTRGNFAKAPVRQPKVGPHSDFYPVRARTRDVASHRRRRRESARPRERAAAGMWRSGG